MRSSLKLAPFGDTFSEEEETEEESESVIRMIGLQFPGEWCTGKSGIVAPDGMIVVEKFQIAQNMVWPQFGNTEFHR